MAKNSSQNASAWISRGFEQLLYDLAKKPKTASESENATTQPHFDIVIVGSGYGGAIAAAELAGCKDKDRTISVCVLERGLEYLPGRFPSHMAELPSHVRFSTPNSSQPLGAREGLFDLRVGPDVCALVANGLGGGSLINAGVMEKADGVFQDEHWPPEFRSEKEREKLYGKAKVRLGAAHGPPEKPIPNTIERHLHSQESATKWRPAKTKALNQLARNEPFSLTSATIAMDDGKSQAGVRLTKCKLCGDCMTGCNHEAKESLDVSLLVDAQRKGAQIYTGATVLRIERDAFHPDRWFVVVVHTDDKLRKREREPLRLSTRRVILAAGTFGSTEILLRSQTDTLRFSLKLGQQFSTNGDAIAVAYDGKSPVHAVADELQPPDKRVVGPTITGMIDLRKEKPRFVVEDLAVPGPLRKLFEELVTTAHVLHRLENLDEDDHGQELIDPCSVDARAIENSSVLAVMGEDGANGALELIADGSAEQGDGAIRVRWPELKDEKPFEDQIIELQELAQGSYERILPNPLWRLLPKELQEELKMERGPLLTVHPLGGCPMGKDKESGAVDYLGRVFNAAAAEPEAPRTHDGLVVLDGSIVPTSLGINPALTIAALALHAVEKLRRHWKLDASDEGWVQHAVGDTRPVFRQPKVPQAPVTEVEFLESMSGPVTLESKDGKRKVCRVELTLRFDRAALADLIRPAERPRAPIAKLVVAEGLLRIFQEEVWNDWRKQPSDSKLKEDDIIELRAPVTGSLTLFQREKSTPQQRIRRAIWTWWCNRGCREIWQEQGPIKFLCAICVWVLWRIGSPKNDGGNSPLTFKLASHAGGTRVLEYDLKIDPPERQCPRRSSVLDPTSFGEKKIRGVKRLAYARKSNPWRQLTEMTLEEFPGYSPEPWALRPRRPVLRLDPKFLADNDIPLLHILKQRDQPSAVIDLVSFVAYFLRVLVSVHLWSFRLPDKPTPREPQRLPGAIKGRFGRPVEPTIEEIEVDQLPDGSPVKIRLTRYSPKRPAVGRPVLMIHGYSASGTTFAHHAVKPNMAEYFYRRKRDVWVLDIRTSCGMPTARLPWTFEDAALVDLPAAIDYVYRAVNDKQGQQDAKKLDVVAHCIGAAMFSMAVLKEPEPGDKFCRERDTLRSRINRVVLSQLGPVMAITPANYFRAYATNYLRNFVPFLEYNFHVEDDPGLVDQLIDRLLATLPYPGEEFSAENPLWPPWRRTPFVGTRHRMDALYGRDFSLVNKDGNAQIDERVLELIDDHFGPLNLETVAQAIEFGRFHVITERSGRNPYVSVDSLRKHWKFPTMGIHGEENGLWDIATLYRNQTLFERAGLNFRPEPLPGFGHQDSLIGKRGKVVFKKVYDFLEGNN